jgi:hypothetical protein
MPQTAAAVNPRPREFAVLPSTKVYLTTNPPMVSAPPRMLILFEYALPVKARIEASRMYQPICEGAAPLMWRSSVTDLVWRSGVHAAYRQNNERAHLLVDFHNHRPIPHHGQNAHDAADQADDECERVCRGWRVQLGHTLTARRA